ncbi:MAG: glucuronate isomerase [Bacteroidales bacterium]|nr:glucuronate isomerase [Bacteroidales bacterium]
MFLNENFLLSNQTAIALYHNYAKELPIIDYHCHLDAKDIYENKPFSNLSEAWLEGDHYKWRLLRANGVDEAYITGNASDYEKFKAWTSVLPKAIGNPIYTWSHMELKQYFGVNEFICEKNADTIWNAVNKKLDDEGFLKRDFIVKSNVKVICTTDDPLSDLKYHQLLKKEENRFKVLPTFRPDEALGIEKSTYLDWITQLSNLTNININSYEKLRTALYKRIEFFNLMGCRLSDHSIEGFEYIETDLDEVNTIFTKKIKNEPLKDIEINKYKSFLMHDLCLKYKEVDWVTQLHIQALRNTNVRQKEEIGENAGFDSIRDGDLVSYLQSLFDNLDYHNNLPKIIVYSLNPKDYLPILALIGSFQKDYPNKLQLGAAWWFNDTKEGIRKQLIEFSNQSLLGNFVGMLTDSRSFLSYPRHEYFRRILCDLVGSWVENGEVFDDMDYLGKLIENISYYNAFNYFNFK